LDQAVLTSGVDVSRIENLVWAGELPDHPLNTVGIQVSRPGLSGLQALHYAILSISAGDLQFAAAGAAGISTPVQAHAHQPRQGSMKSGEPGSWGDAHSHNSSSPNCSAVAAILASTQVIGSLNLLPSARLARIGQSHLSGPSTPVEVGGLINKLLSKEGITLADIDYFSLDSAWVGSLSLWFSESDVDLARINPGESEAHFPHQGEAQDLIRVCQLQRLLETHTKKWGLLLQVNSNLDAIVIIIERV
jgi:acetyl-CoA acetyltransferase